MIEVNSFFTGTLNTVDSVIGTFVKNAYDNMNANIGVITGLFTLYVVILGYRILTHREKADLATILHRLVVLLCVFGMVLQWKLYNIFVYNIFTNEPANITKILVDAAGSNQSGASISQTLDQIYEAVLQATGTFFGQVGFSVSGLSFILYGLLTLIIGSALCVVALLLFIYAKMMMAISLALGPVFILFVLWEPTKDIFAAWLRKLITIASLNLNITPIYKLQFNYVDGGYDASGQTNAVGSFDPTKLNWKYSFTGSRALAPIEAFDNGQFTYFKFKTNGMNHHPTVFIVDKKRNETLVNYHMQGGYMVINSVAKQFTLRDGAYVTSVYNDYAIGDWQNI